MSDYNRDTRKENTKGLKMDKGSEYIADKKREKTKKVELMSGRVLY